MNPYSATGKPVDQRFAAFCKEITANLWNKYSQNGEDCIIEAIFKRLQPKHKIVVECGAADGLWFSNSRHLIENGWKSLLIEGDEETFEKLFNLYKADDNVALECRTVQAQGQDRFDAIFAEHGLPEDFDLLIIDVDGTDYYLFNSLVHYRPAVIVCEYDAAVDPMFVPEYGKGQAGKDAVRYVGETAKNYVTLCATKTNLFFVRRDYAHLFTSADESTQPGQLPPTVDYVAPYDEKVNRFLKHAKGVIHVGANEGQERIIYRQYGVPAIWIEPVPDTFERLTKNIADFPNQKAYRYLVTDKDGDERAMHIVDARDGDGEASSIFAEKMVRQMFPWTKQRGGFLSPTISLDTMVKRESINLDDYDTLILDVQGAELLVLQGASEVLDRMNFVRAEVADFDAYEGGCQSKDIDEFLTARGLYRVGTWAARRESYGGYYEVLYARHPHFEGDRIKVAAAMSTPRVGFLANMDCIMQSLLPFSIPLARGEGAFWSHTLTRAIEKSLEEVEPDYILTIDYDSIFTDKEVAQIVMLAHDNPWADVIVPMQQKREGGELLASTTGEVSLADRLLPLKYGHFGLTLFKADVFERLPRPWFYEKPDPDGRWQEGRVDADIGFWQNCQDVGLRVMLATDVVIGHLEQVVSVPDVNLNPLYMSVYNYRAGLRPDNMFSRQRVEDQIRVLDMG